MLGTRLPRETKAGWLIHAPAKLNVYLDVLPQRPDGFHNLRTLLCPVRLGDSLLIRPTEEGESRIALSVHSCLPSGGLPRSEAEPAPADDTNLVVRALRALWQVCGVAPSCAVTLWKRIPSQAGLGGGSSDAAAALLAANHIWRLGLSIAELERVAAHVGSDVPGLLHRRATLCEGRGAAVTPARIPSGMACVIAKPPVGLSTAEVFRHCEPSDGNARSDWSAALLEALRRGAWEELPRLMTNRLQPTAQRLCRAIAQLEKLFSRFPFVTHQMTGSGSAFFGLCRNHRQAARAAAWLRGQRVGWVAATSTC